MKKARVLIVEDDSATAKLFKLMLASGGYAVVGTAATGAEAIETALKAQPDLILMDIRLKGEVDGITAFRELRKSLQTPIVFVTAHADSDSIERAMACRPDGYIVKPFTIETLLGTVASVLDWQRIIADE